jgi:hypothetical protein
MIRKTERMKVCDIPKGVDHTVPGVDPREVIPSYPEFLNEGVSFRMLYDNEVTQFIKKCFLRVFHRR